MFTSQLSWLLKYKLSYICHIVSIVIRKFYCNRHNLNSHFPPHYKTDIFLLSNFSTVLIRID